MRLSQKTGATTKRKNITPHTQPKKPPPRPKKFNPEVEGSAEVHRSWSRQKTCTAIDRREGRGGEEVELPERLPLPAWVSDAGRRGETQKNSRAQGTPAFGCVQE